MRVFLLALVLLLSGAGWAHADALRWYDCKEEFRKWAMVQNLPFPIRFVLTWTIGIAVDIDEVAALLEKVVDAKRTSTCIRVKVKEWTIMTATLEPADGSYPFPKDLLRELKGMGSSYKITEQPAPYLRALIYRAIPPSKNDRRPTLVVGMEVYEQTVRHRFTLAFYGHDVAGFEIEEGVQLILDRLGLTCEQPLCRRP